MASRRRLQIERSGSEALVSTKDPSDVWRGKDGTASDAASTHHSYTRTESIRHRRAPDRKTISTLIQVEAPRLLRGGVVAQQVCHSQLVGARMNS
jgi:hypothetical protein